MRWRPGSASTCLFVLGAAVALSAAGLEPDLLRAVKAGNLADVRVQVQNKADINAKEVDGTTALHWATRAGDLETARLLIAAGADVNVVNRYGVTPLSLAVRAGAAPLVQSLLQAGADTGTADAALADGQTVLMLAARTGSVDTVKALAGRGDVNAREQRTGTTALMWAAIDNHAAALRALIDAGADLNIRSKVTEYPHTPPGVVGDKVEEGASYVGQTVLPKGGWTALMYAARQGALDAARTLAEAHADLDATDQDGSSALMFAVINGHYDVAARLVAEGADPNVADRTGATPLYAAVDMHTMATTFGRPDLPAQVVAGSVDAIRMLLAHGADPNARLKAKIIKRVYNPGDPRLAEGATAFMRAAKGGDVAVMRLLVDAGADPKLAQKNGNSPIILAAGMAANRAGNNPDHGTEEGAIEAIKLCVGLGADVNEANAAGDTAVHAAINSPSIIRALTEFGANPDVKNKQGRTPLAAALRARETPEKSVALLRALTGDTTTQGVPDKVTSSRGQPAGKAADKEN